MLETPRGILYAREIAGARRLGALVLGTSDLTTDLRALPSRDRLPLLTALSLAILAARANELTVLDGVHLDLTDDEGFVSVCRQGRELGFDGKTLIHPKQIAEANAAFAPAKEEIAWSRRIIAAYAEAIAAGKSIVLVDGRLVEGLHVKDATRLLALEEEIRHRSGLA
jgi:citrate lyase subunit beta/citryl-CoA lyase